jgi:hypothetical protein
MSFENSSEGSEKVSNPLEIFFRRMDEEDQVIIENDIFNSADSIPLETVFEVISNTNEARMVMSLFSQYLKDREFLQKEQRVLRAKEINEFVGRRL